MISEYEYNRGAPELECEAEIEWAPYPNLPYISTTFIVIYEMDGGCHLNGAYLPNDESDEDFLPSFTDDQRDQAIQDCISDYEYRCDMAEAREEDRGDWLYEQRRDA